MSNKRNKDTLNITARDKETLTALRNTYESRFPVQLDAIDTQDGESVSLSLSLDDAKALAVHLTELVARIEQEIEDARYALPTEPGYYTVAGNDSISYALDACGTWWWGSQSRTPAVMKAALGRHALVCLEVIK